MVLPIASMLDRASAKDISSEKPALAADQSAQSCQLDGYPRNNKPAKNSTLIASEQFVEKLPYESSSRSETNHLSVQTLNSRHSSCLINKLNSVYTFTERNSSTLNTSAKGIARPTYPEHLIRFKTKLNRMNPVPLAHDYSQVFSRLGPLSMIILWSVVMISTLPVIVE